MARASARLALLLIGLAVVLCVVPAATAATADSGSPVCPYTGNFLFDTGSNPTQVGVAGYGVEIYPNGSGTCIIVHGLPVQLVVHVG